MADPSARFLSPGAAFAAQAEEETRLQIALERALTDLADHARTGMTSYSLSQVSLRRQWEEAVDRAVASLEIAGPAADQLRTTLMDFDAGGELFEVADSVMKMGLSAGATPSQTGEALDLIIGDPSLVAAGGLKDLWGRIKEWVTPRRRHLRSKARTITRTAYTGYAGHLAQTWLHANGHASKMWVTRHDDRVRTTHREADGQVVPIDQKFQVGLAELTYPGERTGPPNETINCRCVLVSGD